MLLLTRKKITCYMKKVDTVDCFSSIFEEKQSTTGGGKSIYFNLFTLITLRSFFRNCPSEAWHQNKKTDRSLFFKAAPAQWQPSGDLSAFVSIWWTKGSSSSNNQWLRINIIFMNCSKLEQYRIKRNKTE